MDGLAVHPFIFILLLGELYYAMRRDWIALSPARLARDDRVLQILGTIGVPLALAFHGGVGALFGTVLARDLWHSPVYPLLFITGALISGGALITFVVAYLWPTKDAAWRELTQDLGRIGAGSGLARGPAGLVQSSPSRCGTVSAPSIRG